jgi:signal transduction histidine kinase
MSSIAVDKGLLRIAINNLLTNAVKYNAPGGTVTLAAEETDDQIRIVVRDTGVGVAPEDKERIFDKFYRSEKPEVRSKSGHGLGLSLAREIVQLHHGVLSLNSMEGQGSEFVMEFSKEKGLMAQVV